MIINFIFNKPRLCYLECMHDGRSRSVDALDCTRTRLAENATVMVDLCSCGVMLVHLGPFTMRMTPCAIEELMLTLGRALERHAAGSRSPAAPLDAARGGPRGQA